MLSGRAKIGDHYEHPPEQLHRREHLPCDGGGVAGELLEEGHRTASPQVHGGHHEFGYEQDRQDDRVDAHVGVLTRRRGLRRR
jgi:hypothetical protein